MLEHARRGSHRSRGRPSVRRGSRPALRRASSGVRLCWVRSVWHIPPSHFHARPRSPDAHRHTAPRGRAAGSRGRYSRHRSHDGRRQNARPAPFVEGRRQRVGGGPLQAHRQGGISRQARPVPLGLDLGPPEGGEAGGAGHGRSPVAPRARGAHVCGQGRARRERREGCVTRPLAPGGARGGVTRRRRRPRARSLSLHQVPHRREKAQGGARDCHGGPLAKGDERRERRDCAGTGHWRGDQPLPRVEQRAGQRDVPRDVCVCGGEARQEPWPEGRGLRFQGDPPSRHEAHRRRRARQRARPARGSFRPGCPRARKRGWSS